MKYTWSLSSAPAGAAATFTANNTNAAKKSSARLTKAGAYTCLVTVADAVGHTKTSSVTCTVGWGALTDTNDIAAALPGVLQYDSSLNAYTLTGGGSDIENTSDQFRFAWQNLAGDGEVIAQVSSLGNLDLNSTTNPWAKAGVMIRNSSGAGSAHAAVFYTPGHGVSFLWRPTDGADTPAVTVEGIGAGAWVKLKRTGGIVAGYYSTDGLSWTQIGSTQSIALGASALAGLAITSHDAAQTARAIFNGVSLLPAGWSDSNIGSPSLKGAAAYNPATNKWIVSGGGNDISGTSDQFNLASKNFTGDGSIIVRVDDYQHVYEWTKVGIMFRNDTSAGSAFAAIVATPQHGIYYLSRASAGGADSGESINAIDAPVWMKLTRSGNSFSAYYGTDGANWTKIGNTRTLSIGSTAMAGFAVNSHYTSLFTKANFSNFQIVAGNSISGNVFNDTNSNGVKDASENGIADWTLYLDANNNGTKDAGEASAATDAFGNYAFGNLSAGTQRVRQVLTSGYRKTLPGSGTPGYEVTVGSGAITGKNFGDTQKILIAGRAFNDVNSDGVQNAGEAALAGVTVQIIANNVVIATRTTDANGLWQVKGLDAGTGKAAVVAPSGFSPTTVGGQYTGSMSSGQQNANLNFGLHKIAAAPAQVFDKSSILRADDIAFENII